MAEHKRTLVFYEGDDDRVVVDGLRRMGLVPADWESAQRDRSHHPGKDGLVRQLLPFVRPVTGVGGSAVVLVDLDELTPAQRVDWFRKELATGIKSAVPPVTMQEKVGASGRIILFALGASDQIGQAVLVPVGLHEDPELRSLGIDRFAIDDFVLRLVREPTVYSAVSELESVAHEVAMKKMSEVADLLRKNGLELHHTKRLLHILRAVAAVRPSSATFIDRLMKKAQETLAIDVLRQMFTPLVADFEEAGQLLLST